MTRSFHPAAELFPLMGGRPFAELVADIRANGLREPILVDSEGKILDGRNRYRACEQAKVEPRFEKWSGEGSATALVISLNLHRRHLDESQRAMVGAQAKPLFEAEAKARQGQRSDIRANLPEGSRARDHAAAIVNVSPRSVENAATVLKNGSPTLVSAVANGKVAVSTAAEAAKLPRDQQREIAAAPKPEQREKLKEFTKALHRVVAENKPARQVPHPKAPRPAANKAEQERIRKVCSVMDAIETMGNPELSPEKAAAGLLELDPAGDKQFYKLSQRSAAYAVQLAKEMDSLCKSQKSA